MQKCSFCERSEKEVQLLIRGRSGNICDSCVIDDDLILNEDANSKSEFNVNSIKLIKPKEIKKMLDQYVIGQEEAKKIISVAVSIFSMILLPSM